MVKNEAPFKVGKGYFFRLATYHVVGIVKKIFPDGIIELGNASWIADSGRFSTALLNGFEAVATSEIEPTGCHFINIGALVDAIPYNHPMPSQKK